LKQVTLNNLLPPAWGSKSIRRGGPTIRAPAKGALVVCGPGGIQREAGFCGDLRGQRGIVGGGAGVSSAFWATGVCRIVWGPKTRGGGEN